MTTGTVKWFNADKGFSFVQLQDSSKDVFVPITTLYVVGINSLSDGQVASLKRA